MAQVGYGETALGILAIQQVVSFAKWAIGRRQNGKTQGCYHCPMRTELSSTKSEMHQVKLGLGAVNRKVNFLLEKEGVPLQDIRALEQPLPGEV
jgi:hypothetical protein